MEDRVKIIKTDGYDRQNVSDVLIADNVHQHYADEIVADLNSKVDESVYFRAVPLDHKLFVYDPR